MGDQNEPPVNGNFFWVGTDEPHATRRRMILKDHPEIKQLYGTDRLMVFKVAAMVAVQFWLVDFTHKLPVWQAFIIAYVIAGTINHTLNLAVHECSHNLAFETPWANKALAMICNLPQMVPSSVAFKRYHLEHHLHQGVDGIDMDIPSVWEGRTFTNVATKTVWVACQAFIYGLRPLIMRPKKPVFAELVNFALVLCSWAYVLHFYGIRGVAFLLGSQLMGMGLHPVAGHFISEHYMFVRGAETYSMYDPFFNFLTLNVGYHNEHHDFPRIPGSRLHLVRKIAPEYYDDLPQTRSWPGTIIAFIMDPTVGPFSRVKRLPKDQRKAARLAEEDKVD